VNCSRLLPGNVHWTASDIETDWQLRGGLF
jgi:hypothetical protein